MLNWLDNFWDGFESGILLVALSTITIGLAALTVKSVVDFIGALI